MTRAQNVLDYIEWMWHCEWVRSLCDSTATAVAVFNSFDISESARRGQGIAP